MTLGMVILGRQGSGKGTQAIRIAEQFGVIHISTGDMLRTAVKEGTELGLQAKDLMDAGELVSDSIINGIVQERLQKEDVSRSGFLLDGYPRTVGQAIELRNLAHDDLKLAINLEVSIKEVTERMISRGRADDTEEAIARRLELYEAETAPLLEWFTEAGILCVVDGLGSETEVYARIVEAVETQDYDNKYNDNQKDDGLGCAFIAGRISSWLSAHLYVLREPKKAGKGDRHWLNQKKTR